MKNATEGTKRDGRRTNCGTAGWQAGPGQTAEVPSAPKRLEVHFAANAHWDMALKPAQPAKPISANRRVLTISQHIDLTESESQIESVVARKMTWAMTRARATANCLRGVWKGC
jgi:hypothetical protein